MKTLIKLVLLVVLLIAVAIGGVTYYLDSIAKKAVEIGGSKALGVATTVDTLHISLLDGRSSLGDFAIANPQGFGQTDFMRLNRGEVAIDLNSLLSDTIRISTISLSGLKVNLEQSNQQSNVKALLKNLPQSASPASGTTATKTEPPEAPTKASGKKLIVDRIVLEDIGVSAQLAALGTQLSTVNITVPRIELTNVGQKQGGVTVAQLIELVVKEVLNATADSSKGLSPALASMLQGDLASVEGLKQGLKAGAMEAASGEVEKATKKLMEDLKLPEGSDTELQQATDQLLKGLLNK